MEKKDLIGRKVTGFSFNKREIPYSHFMDDYIGCVGIIKHYNEYNQSYDVEFADSDWQYPASEIEKHLVEEKDWTVNIEKPTYKHDQDLLDKFALTALPAVIKESSVHAPKSDIAKECYEIAREMMKERSKGL